MVTKDPNNQDLQLRLNYNAATIAICKITVATKVIGGSKTKVTVMKLHSKSIQLDMNF